MYAFLSHHILLSISVWFSRSTLLPLPFIGLTFHTSLPGGFVGGFFVLYPSLLSRQIYCLWNILINFIVSLVRTPSAAKQPTRVSPRSDWTVCLTRVLLCREIWAKSSEKKEKQNQFSHRFSACRSAPSLRVRAMRDINLGEDDRQHVIYA